MLVIRAAADRLVLVLLAMLLLAMLLLAMLLLAPVAFADDASDKAALDVLFAELRVAPDAETARTIDRQIWGIWTSPSDDKLATRMRAVQSMAATGNLPAAVKMLDQLVIDYPAYAEGWNQRATLHYMMNDYEASLADIDKVLEFEPRHFGALAGRVLIYLAQGKRALAIRDMSAALAIHPFLNERQLFPELQEDMVRI